MTLVTGDKQVMFPKMAALRIRLKSLLLIIGLLAWYMSNVNALKQEETALSRFRNENGKIKVYHSQSYLGLTRTTGMAYKKPTGFMNRIGAYFDANLFERIYDLQLMDSNLDDDSLKCVAELRNLKTLGMYETAFSQTAVESFRKLRPDVKLEI